MRSRWGVRTSNPGGAVSRSYVGSTPSLFRQLAKGARVNDSSPDKTLDSLNALMAEARQAEAAEAAYRKEAAREIDRLALARSHAYRRYHTMRMLSEAAGQCASTEEACSMQWAALCTRLNWEDDESEARKSIKEALQPVFLAVDCQYRPVEDDAAPPDPVGAIKAFEAWYEARMGRPFWHVFDVYTPETPVVDF